MTASQRQCLRLPRVRRAQARFQNLLRVPADLRRAEAFDGRFGLQAVQQIFGAAAIGCNRIGGRDRFCCLAGPLPEPPRGVATEGSLGARCPTVLFVTHDIDEAVFMGTRVVVMSARPGRIKLDRVVPLAHPRHYSLKTSPEFSALKAELTEAVRVEVLAAQEASAQHHGRTG